MSLAALSGAAGDPPLPRARPHSSATAASEAAPKTESTKKSARPAETEISGALPLSAAKNLPAPEDEAARLHKEIRVRQPAMAAARENSQSLNAQAADLQKKLIVTAHEIEGLENRELKLAGNIARLSAENAILGRHFAKNRGTVTRQLAVLERLNHAMPPAMVMKSGDVLAAARASMMMGATLPKIYQRTADLARRLERIRNVRAKLTKERDAASRNATSLRQSRTKLDGLLTVRQQQAAAATRTYQSLRDSYLAAAKQSASLDALLRRIDRLKKRPETRGWISVSANPVLKPTLIRPVAGKSRKGGMDGVGGASAPGVTYTSVSGAQVVAPADGRIRYAGPYQKRGLVLILEMANGYDAVLAGLDHVSVATGDRVLAGEPIGRLPAGLHKRAKLYFELRHDGRGLNPVRFMNAG